jgi:hypothetical protein
MRISFTILLTLTTTQLFSQTFPYWGKLTPGKYDVGFMDTVLYNSNSEYQYKEYKGGKPFFIAIWYPAERANGALMSFGDYMRLEGAAEVRKVKQDLSERYDSIYMRDVITKQIVDMKPSNAVLNEEHFKLLEDVKGAKVNARRDVKKANGDFPVIYYHHGAQSTLLDNIVFCEYMTSHGYVVISSNYLWPMENQMRLGESKALHDVEFVVSSMRPLIGKNPPYLIGAGHSWGAQTLIMFDTLEQKPFRQIIAFHTTLEDKPVPMAVKYWPDLMNALQKKHQRMTTPTVIFAPGYGQSAGYNFLTFRENKTTPYTCLVVKTKYLTHDGFITLGNLRAPFASKYNMKDKQELALQQEFYEKIVILTRELIQNPLKVDEKLRPELQSVFDLRFANTLR